MWSHPRHASPLFSLIHSKHNTRAGGHGALPMYSSLQARRGKAPPASYAQPLEKPHTGSLWAAVRERLAASPTQMADGRRSSGRRCRARTGGGAWGRLRALESSGAAAQEAGGWSGLARPYGVPVIFFKILQLLIVLVAYVAPAWI